MTFLHKRHEDRLLAWTSNTGNYRGEGGFRIEPRQTDIILGCGDFFLSWLVKKERNYEMKIYNHKVR